MSLYNDEGNYRIEDRNNNNPRSEFLSKSHHKRILRSILMNIPLDT